MKQVKTIFLLIITVTLAGGLYAWFFYFNKPKQNIKNAAAIQVQAVTLFDEYSMAEKTTNDKYIDKVIEVWGEVLSATKNNEGKQVILLKTNDPFFGINCTMEEEWPVQAGDHITLKGICTGYLTDVVLIRCYKINDMK